MSKIECPVCTKIRTIENVSTRDGWVNPPCYSCGDPGWTQPYNQEDPFFGRIRKEPRVHRQTNTA